MAEVLPDLHSNFHGIVETFVCSMAYRCEPNAYAGSGRVSRFLRLGDWATASISVTALHFNIP